MLKPVCKKYEDSSTLEKFKFTFYCDCCSRVVRNVVYPYSPPFKPKLFTSSSERRARELIWLFNHTNAYERANNEAMLYFNYCPVCGSRVCDDCFHEEEGICKECVSRMEVKGEAYVRAEIRENHPKEVENGIFEKNNSQRCKQKR